MIPNQKVVLIVVGTLAWAVIAYVITLATCSIMGYKPDPKVLEYLKDIGLLCAGAISGILSRTSTPQTGPVEPIPVTNAPGESIDVTPVPER